MPPEKTILIAEDLEPDLQSLLGAIQLAGVLNPFHVVHDGQTAIHYLEGKGAYSDRERFPFPSILMLDLNMPKRHGFEVLNYLGEHLLSVRLLKIVLTGHVDRRLIDRAYGLGANSFLHKPTRSADLLNLVSFFPEYWLLAGQPKSALITPPKTIGP